MSFYFFPCRLETLHLDEIVNYLHLHFTKTITLNEIVFYEDRLARVMSIENDDYRIHLVDKRGESCDGDLVEFTLKEDDIQRDVFSLSKKNIRLFVKECATRKNTFGAQWIVKAFLVKYYGIKEDMTVQTSITPSFKSISK